METKNSVHSDGHKTKSNERGIALLITLSVMAVLVPIVLEFNYRTRLSLETAAARRDQLTLNNMCDAGLSAAMAMLIKDKKETKVDSIQEDWADEEKTAQVVKALPFDSGTLKIKITDELSKIQANALVRYPQVRQFNLPQMRLWQRFLALTLLAAEEELEEIEPDTIVDSLKDWLDSGDDDAVTGLNGAESEYYLDLEPPYRCKNGPLTITSELMLVKGITPELFQGSTEKPGIGNFLTAYGSAPAPGETFKFEGGININTAPMPVLAALLPAGSEDMAQAMVEFRDARAETKFVNDLSAPAWYKNVPGMGGVVIDPALITNASDIFRIDVTATQNDRERRIKVVVKREKDKTGKWHCRVLNRQAI